MSNTQYRGEKIHHKIHRHAVHHVHRLRGKSDSHKKAVSFTIAFSVTFIVFVLWYFLSLPKIFEDYQVKLSENKRLDKNRPGILPGASFQPIPHSPPAKAARRRGCILPGCTAAGTGRPTFLGQPLLVAHGWQSSP